MEVYKKQVCPFFVWKSCEALITDENNDDV